MIVNNRILPRIILFNKQFGNEIPFVSKAVCTISVTILVFDKIYAKWFRKPKDENFYECWFVTDKGLRKVPKADMFSPVTKPFTNFINGAKVKLCLCFFTITSIDVVNAILQSKRRGVKVTLITNHHQGLYESEIIKKLIKAGIKVLSNHTDEDTLMHHKFMIRDDSDICISSMNPTASAASGSFDNFFSTNDCTLVVPFLQLFNDMVKKFS